MKKVFIAYIVGVLLMSANQVSALSYKDVSFSDKSIKVISSSSLSEAKLLQNYVIRYKEKINTLYQEYSKEESKVLTDANTILDKMSYSLEKIGDKYLDDYDSEEVMKSIVNDLKTLNERIKVYLDHKKSLHENTLLKKKKQFLVVGKKISSILDTLINNISSVLVKKESLSSYEKEIVESLVNIRTENNKIKIFNTINFESEEEMKMYFENIIKNVRSEILTIKELSKR